MVIITFFTADVVVVNAQSVFGRALVPLPPIEQKSTLPVASTSTKPVSDLEATLQKKRKDIDQIQKKIQEYYKEIERQRGKSLTLQNQLLTIRTRIDAAKLKIDETNSKIEVNTLERKALDEKLAHTQKEIADQKETLSRMLRLLNSEQEQPLITIALKEPNLSTYYDALQGTLSLRSDINSLIDQRERLLQSYQLQQAALAQKHLDLQQLDRELTDRNRSLSSEEVTKDSLLNITKRSEATFQQLLQRARAEQLQADADIRSLENKIREQLRERGLSSKLSPDGSVSFVWPVPNQGIAAYFHDPDYPFRNIFEHPAVDIRTLVGGKPSNGMPIRAASSGYVARARDGGARGYSYIMLIHNNQFSTVYGHVSQMNVAQDEFVSQGQVIGFSGGSPGTHGAGPLTTGPHLHFEVRKNGIPVNPLDYLP